jgi:hypothetical protein
MSRTVFKLVWDTIQKGDEIFAYVKNMAKDDSYYWVFAHVTPTMDTFLAKPSLSNLKLDRISSNSH